MNEWMFSPEVVSSLKKTWKGWGTMTTTERSDTSNSQYKYKSRLVGKNKCQQHLCLNLNKIEEITVLETAGLSYGPSQNWRTLCGGTNLTFPLTSFGQSTEDQTQWTPRSRNAQPFCFSKLQMTLTWQALPSAVWQHLPCWSKQEQPLHTSWSSDRSQGWSTAP